MYIYMYVCMYMDMYMCMNTWESKRNGGAQKNPNLWCSSRCWFRYGLLFLSSHPLYEWSNLVLVYCSYLLFSQSVLSVWIELNFSGKQRQKKKESFSTTCCHVDCYDLVRTPVFFYWGSKMNANFSSYDAIFMSLSAWNVANSRYLWHLNGHGFKIFLALFVISTELLWGLRCGI